ncbi:non-ribosomal peptide synthetase [Paractinoplanes hotanensis]|uniref:Amino acid adenylation domain-containing protein n=1 Tax=Paractinoplanes hotanensis TaxID=2906497 RepID=A0ABT0YAQ4_9ACTN|nr:amino acid adenylation domain-containing protein [Actinoplanes hotanensis]MCM4083114.1 amino acid adenylation domain-containing protein [Actinoplanes hotanensis]
MTELSTPPQRRTHVPDRPADLTFWHQHLRTAPTRLDLDLGGASGDGAGSPLRARLDPEVSAAADALQRRERAGVLMVALAAVTTWAARFSGQNAVVVHSPISRVDTAPLPLSLPYRGDRTFVDLTRAIRDVTLDALAHRDVTAAAVLAGLPAPIEPELALTVAADPAIVAPGPAALHLVVSDEMTDVLLHFRPDEVDPAAAARVLDQFVQVFAGAVRRPEDRLDALSLLTDADWALLDSWRTAADRLTAAPLPVELFDAVAAQDGTRIAVRAGAEVLTFDELDRRSDRLAARLRAGGATAGSTVAVCVDRSSALPVAFLAALKAGVVYLPLDPRHPVDRLRQILLDAGAVLAVAVPATVGALAAWGGDVLEVGPDEGPAEPVAHRSRPEDVAYLIYTSGTSGTPKGVEITHGGLGNLAAFLRATFELGPADTVSLFSSASFDASVWEMAMGLFSGATLGILATADATPAEIAREARSLGLTVGTYPPTLLHTLRPADLGSPRLIVSAGEACDGGLVDTWSPGRRFVNAYGPTEVTVCATFADCTAGASRRPPVGRALPNTTVYLLDERLRPVPVGAPGEVYVAGAGVARGYRDRPALTARAFLPDPLGPPGSRMYATGDRGRFGPDGSLHFLGRLDDQVKLRGFRIELGEIEQQLLRHPEVRDAVVVLRATGDEHQLVAYLTLRSADADGAAVRASLRAALGRALPDYMMPASYVLLGRMPLTTSGKVDRRQLPAPVDTSTVAEDAQWHSPVAKAMAVIWAQALGVSAVQPDDNFFELGGHSLVAAQVLDRARQEFGVDALAMRTLFEHPELADFAEAVRAQQAGN